MFCSRYLATVDCRVLSLEYSVLLGTISRYYGIKIRRGMLHGTHGAGFTWSIFSQQEGSPSRRRKGWCQKNLDERFAKTFHNCWYPLRCGIVDRPQIGPGSIMLSSVKGVITQKITHDHSEHFSPNLFLMYARERHPPLVRPHPPCTDSNNTTAPNNALTTGTAWASVSCDKNTRHPTPS